MLLGTIVISDAGIARIGLFHAFLPPWLDPTVFMLIPLIVWDLATLGRVHRTTIKGGLLVAAVLLLSVPLGMTKPWHAVVETLIGGPTVPAGQIA